MTTIHSTVSGRTLDIIQDLYGLDGAVVRIGESAVIHVKTADLRAAVNAIDPKPYRPIDRDRWVRHIEDVEAALARRNRRHEQDQERIRELEADVSRARWAVEVQVQRVKELAETKTAREYLNAAWDAAIAPEDGVIRKGEEAMVMVHGRGDGPGVVVRGVDVPSRPAEGVEYRLLEPRPELTEEERCQALIEEHGLADWEIELLRGDGR